MEMAELALLAAAAQAAGGVIAGASALQQSKATAASSMQGAGFEAEQLRRAAAADRAAGQRAAFAKRSEGDVLESRQKALAAGSGAGVATPTILHVLGEMARRKELQASSEDFRGRLAAVDKQNRAAMRLVEAQNAAAAAQRKGQTDSLVSALGAGATLASAGYNYYKAPDAHKELLGH